LHHKYYLAGIDYCLNYKNRSQRLQQLKGGGRSFLTGYDRPDPEKQGRKTQYLSVHNRIVRIVLS